jgi:hypothetical protein
VKCGPDVERAVAQLFVHGPNRVSRDEILARFCPALGQELNHATISWGSMQVRAKAEGFMSKRLPQSQVIYNVFLHSPLDALAMPVGSINATWSRLLASERLRRSSQVLSVIDQAIWIFGGEVLPRQPVDNQVDVVSLKPGLKALTKLAKMVLINPRHFEARDEVN